MGIFDLLGKKAKDIAEQAMDGVIDSAAKTANTKLKGMGGLGKMASGTVDNVAKSAKVTANEVIDKIINKK